jgi:GxxExxY protein
VYERALAYELELRGLAVQRQVAVTVHYKGLAIEGQRLDMVVAPGVVLELKAVERLAPIHEAKLISYLLAGGFRLGLLINFNNILLRDGIKRIIK